MKYDISDVLEADACIECGHEEHCFDTYEYWGSIVSQEWLDCNADPEDCPVIKEWEERDEVEALLEEEDEEE